MCLHHISYLSSIRPCISPVSNLCISVADFAHKGTNTFFKILKNKEKKTGCTVHFVTEKLDSGKIILKKSFNIEEKFDVENLKSKTQKVEHKAFSEAITRLYINL